MLETLSIAINASGNLRRCSAKGESITQTFVFETFHYCLSKSNSWNVSRGTNSTCQAFRFEKNNRAEDGDGRSLFDGRNGVLRNGRNFAASSFCCHSVTSRGKNFLNNRPGKFFCSWITGNPVKVKPQRTDFYVILKYNYLRYLLYCQINLTLLQS